MRLYGFFWRIFLPVLALAVGTILLADWYASRSLREFYLRQAAADLRDRGELVREEVAGLLRAGRLDSLQAMVERVGARSDTRITVIAPDGTVLADSQEPPATMDNHAGRPEVAAALAGRIGQSRRYSRTIDAPMLYLAQPLAPGTTRGPVLRTALLLSDIDAALWRVQSRILLGGLVLALLAAAMAWGLSRALGRPLRELERGAERFAAGELDRRLTAADSREIAGLSDAMNTMAARLSDRIAAVEAQRRELQTILGSMVEGVLAVDPQERVITLNRAGARMLGVDPERALGRSVQEVVRNADLEALLSEAMGGAGTVERDLELPAGGLSLQVRATPLHGLRGGEERAGLLVVMNDITRVRKLENVRREFVANVSHELKTPITSIKGFVETLLGGARDEPEQARRFLEIVAAQADRLQAIVEDLLLLSRLEQGVEGARAAFARVPVASVLAAAVQTCAPRAEARGVPVSVACPPDLQVRGAQMLLEQAVVNLLNNAIQYSEPGAPVRLEGRAAGGEVEISVADAGAGIAPEHLPRIFERFYRVDRARSRKQGGTGLGLSIVKHIVQVHGGRVEVDSRPGRGSVFRLLLPGD